MLVSLFSELEFPVTDALIPCSISGESAEKRGKYWAYELNRFDLGLKKHVVFHVNGNNREFARGDTFKQDCLLHHYLR